MSDYIELYTFRCLSMSFSSFSFCTQCQIGILYRRPFRETHACNGNNAKVFH